MNHTAPHPALVYHDQSTLTRPHYRQSQWMTPSTSQRKNCVPQ
ncbi:Uncharacterised protein [Vibrio cholerae]|nr:Uncharacterised protein [Vibrio cholerae]